MFKNSTENDAFRIASYSGMCEYTMQTTNLSPGATGNYMRQLDGLRALAVIAVIFSHTLPVTKVSSFGWLGVRSFYVLSGFLITGILLRAKEESSTSADAWYSLRSFYIRRLLRIFPLYYLVLGICVLLALVPIQTYLASFFVSDTSRLAAIETCPPIKIHWVWTSLFTYTSNWQAVIQGHGLPEPYSHFWTLAVEEQFYLFWPVFVFFLPRRAFPYGLIAVILSGPLSRFLIWHWNGNQTSASGATFSCLDALGGGAALAFLTHYNRLSCYRKSVGAFCVLIGSLLFAVLVFMKTKYEWHATSVVFKDVSATLVCTWIVNRATTGFTGAVKRFLEWRPLVYVGTISYGMYVYHMFLISVLSWLAVVFGRPDIFPNKDGLQLFIYVSLATIAVASLSWHFFEKPLNNLKKHFPYSQKSRFPSCTESQAMRTGERSLLSEGQQARTPQVDFAAG